MFRVLYAILLNAINAATCCLFFFSNDAVTFAKVTEKVTFFFHSEQSAKEVFVMKISYKNNIK